MDWQLQGTKKYWDDNPEENPSAEEILTDVWMAYCETDKGQEVVAVHYGDPDSYIVTEFTSFQDAWENI